MKNKRIHCYARLLLIVFLFSLFCNPVAIFADVKLPALISDNMVLQQGKEVSIWGWADPGEKVTVSVSWLSIQWAIIANSNGQWIFKMRPPKAGGPYEINLMGKNTITIKNVMVGEVWVCSGQSNMEWPVRLAANAEKEIAEANYPDIRMFTVRRNVADEPQADCNGGWAICNSQTVLHFSAIGYFFGRDLYKQLNVPIGLIHSSWGGTPAEAWTKQEVLESIPECVPILKRFNDAVTKFPQAQEEYKKKLEEWKQYLQKAKENGTKPPLKPYEPYGPGHFHSPGGLYNGMITPLLQYRIKGAIWYQGESNADRAYQYRKLFPAMIKNWRKDWGQGDFPFIFVQLTNYKAAKPEQAESDWAELREAQLKTLELPNTGMAVIIDIGDANNIHPLNKHDVGKRLALWALANTYGKELVYSGPMYKSMKIEVDKIILDFDHIGGGLVAYPDEPLKGFAISGADHKFVWADAKIDGNTVVVSSSEVSSPVAVRYAWADNPVCNLYNKEDLPATPFRTDDWPGMTIDRK